jgi:DNA helicase-2/ATP-dependent DNA helicase PcrA
MSHWQKIRDAADNLRREICAANDLDENALLRAGGLLDSAAAYLELDLIPEHPDSNNLSRAMAVLEDDCVYFNNHLKSWYKTFCIAHEIGHFVLHHQSVHCTREEISDLAAGGEANGAVEKLIGYGAGMRREREANLFALELILPCAVLKNAFLEKNMSAGEIAEAVGMPVGMVAGQLACALLVPAENDDDETGEENATRFDLDLSQKRAAEDARCPTLVAAGPGTGKTQTLTRRIEHLLEKGIDPKRILALTFSNKAAEEMRERIGRTSGEEAAARIQVMTFHAYGFDILRTYWQEAGLEARSKLLDKIDALLYLEKNLNFLDLEHYQMLHDPTANLAAVLGAISRAKDELCGPEQYRALGEKMLAAAEQAQDEELKLKAQKVLETARVYGFYEDFLKKEKLLDFGDLIFRAVRLLRENEAVKREVCAKYDAILVDEFQDVNRACGMLLKEIAGCGERLWAVGDLRQSIYRWRGASPANIDLFAADFPEAETLPLEANYRSFEEIITLFSRFAETMKAGGREFFHSWEPKRGAGAEKNKRSVRFEICDSLETEAARIAEHIKNYHAEGIRYKDCAVICRTHNQLGRFAEILAEKQIPVFYLGELFERDEVRDLLALLDLKFSLDGHSLIRVARFPEYRIPLEDAQKIIARQKKDVQTFGEVLKDEEFVKELSETGKEGALKLARHLNAYPPEFSAWQFLCFYLFNDSRFLSPFFADDDVQNRSRRLAVYQFLRLAQSAEERFQTESRPVAEFLNYVKKLAYFNEDKNYAQIPPEAENLDAVRLLTVHSAKGLEFPVVFLPYLGAGKIPLNKKRQICPNPDGMIEGETDFHAEEEECLFFVAMSRARDHLHLSRASKYGESNSNESKFLSALKEVLPPAETFSAEAGEPAEEVFADGEDAGGLRRFYAGELDRYLKCPRDYFYTHVLGLEAAGEKPIYLKFHSCIYDTLRSLQSIKQLGGAEFTETAALARLDDFWQAAGIDQHPYAPIYRRRAEEIVRRLFRRIQNSGAGIVGPSYEVKLSNASVSVRLDAVEIVDAGGEKQAVIRKYKTGKSPKKIDAENADVLMTVAAAENFPDAKPVLQKIYLSDDEIREVSVTDKVIKKRLEKYEKAVEGIRRKKFDPSPSDNNCPHCPHFFICPSG